MANTRQIDQAAIGFSLACMVHCAVLPVFAVSMPLVGLLADAEWVHWLFTFLAVGAAITTVATAHAARVASFVVPALAGIFLLLLALIADPLGIGETIPTVSGATLLASAHLYRLYKNP